MARSLLPNLSPTWIPAGAEASFEGVSISNAIQYGHLAACSDSYLAVATGFNAGGSVALLNLSKPGRYDGGSYYRAQCHSNTVTDLAWSRSILATSSLDKTVKLWRVQSHNGEVGEPSVLDQIGNFFHRDRVVNVCWSPTHSNILANALYGRKIIVWNIEAGQIQSVHSSTAGAYSLDWSADGRLAAASRDKRLAVFDVDRGEKKPVALIACHQGSKPWKAAFMDDSTVMTIGFGLEGSKEVAIWDLTNPSSPLERIRCNQSSGNVIMNYYRESRYFFLSGRGDNGIQLFKYDNRSMNMVGQFQSPYPYRDICWMQQEYLDSNSHEIGRCFRLFLPDTSVVLSTGSNRRNNLFCTNPYQLDFGGPFGLTNSHSCRKLLAPLIEPLSIRLQERRLDESDEEIDQETLTISTYSKIGRPSSSSARLESSFTKRQKVTGPSKTPSFGSGDYLNGAMVAMHFSNDDSRLGGPNIACFKKDENEEELQKSLPISPKPKTKRTWTNWKIIPDTFHGKLNRMVERKSSKSSVDVKRIQKEEHLATDKLTEECRDLEKGRNSDDEILFITSAFSGNRTNLQSVQNKHKQKLNEADGDDETYAACSVSDLVAAFEAKAAQIAAMETSSICSETMSTIVNDSASLSPLEIQPLKKGNHVENFDAEFPNLTIKHPLNRNSQPAFRMYASSNHARWSISHSSGFQMSPAHRYMQRSQRTSLNILRTYSNSDNSESPPSAALSRRPSLRIPIVDNRSRSGGSLSDTPLKGSLLRKPKESSPIVTTFLKGMQLSGGKILSKTSRLDELDVPTTSPSINNEDPASDSRNDSGDIDFSVKSAQTRPIYSSEVHMNNSKLRDCIYYFLENDLSGTSAATVIKDKPKRRSKCKRQTKYDSSENDTIRKGKMKLSQVGDEGDETNYSEETLTITNNDISDKSTHLKPHNGESSIPEVNASERREKQEQAALRLIPFLGPIAMSKLSLLDDLQLLRMQVNSADSQRSIYQSEPHKFQALLDTVAQSANTTMALDRGPPAGAHCSNASDPTYSFVTESRDHQHEDKRLTFTSPMTLTPPNQMTNEDRDSYAPYLRDLESTVRRCCSIWESDVSSPATSDAVQRSKEATVMSETKMTVPAHTAPLQVSEASKDSVQTRNESSPGGASNCDECIGMVTEPDTDLPSSACSVSAHD